MSSPLARAVSNPCSSSKTTAPRARRGDVLQNQQRFAGARRPDDQGTRAAGKSTDQEAIERPDAARDEVADKPRRCSAATRRGNTPPVTMLTS
jgi:hypothetical protein